MFPSHNFLNSNKNSISIPVKYNYDAYHELFNIYQSTSNVSSNLIDKEAKFLIFASNVMQPPSKDENGNWVISKHEKINVRSLKGFYFKF
jgi:hypothetical protein